MLDADNFSGHYPGRHESSPLDALALIQLRELFSDADHDIARIVDVIRQHPSLTAEAIRRSNNVVFSGQERTTDLHQAVNRLGFYEIYEIVSADTHPEPQPTRLSRE